MRNKLNWGLLKHKKIGFKQVDFQYSEILLTVKQTKDTIQFVFSNGYKLEVLSNVFNHLLIRYENETVWFIYDKDSSNIVSGMIAFSMFDTHGFPVELTQEIFEEQNLKVDIEGFNVLRMLQKQKSENTFKGQGLYK